MTLNSMTGFASAQGSHGPHSWTVELRSVNAKGLDLRLRIPDWLEGLEVWTKSHLSKSLARGNVSMTLRVSREEDGGTSQQLNASALAGVLAAMAEIEAQARDKGLALAPTSAAEVLSLRGVMEQASVEDDPAPLVAAIQEQMLSLVADFTQMRAAEGAELVNVLSGQLDQIETLQSRAVKAAEARKPLVVEALKTNLARVLDNSDGADPDRVAQELALLAVKADVTEEIDRLRAHIAAARDLLGQGGPVGRRLDFLSQEFNREANTLCSKAQNSDLTAIGLELKAVIDQMREQVQNVE